MKVIVYNIASPLTHIINLKYNTEVYPDSLSCNSQFRIQKLKEAKYSELLFQPLLKIFKNFKKAYNIFHKHIKN